MYEKYAREVVSVLHKAQHTEEWGWTMGIGDLRDKVNKGKRWGRWTAPPFHRLVDQMVKDGILKVRRDWSGDAEKKISFYELGDVPKLLQKLVTFQPDNPAYERRQGAVLHQIGHKLVIGSSYRDWRSITPCSVPYQVVRFVHEVNLVVHEVRFV